MNRRGRHGRAHTGGEFAYRDTHQCHSPSQFGKWVSEHEELVMALFAVALWSCLSAVILLSR